MIKAIVLDFDGVIIESLDVKTSAFRELFSRYTNDVDPLIEYHLKNNGVSRFIKFKHIWQNILNKKYNDSIAKDLGKEFSDIVTKKVIQCPFVKGAIDFLETFNSKMPLYVASAVPEEELTIIIHKKNIGKYFKGIYGYPPVTKKEAVLDVMHKNSISAKDILFIGDSVKDMEAAKETGAFFVGRKNKENLEEHNVPLFNDLNQIKQYVEKEIRN